MKIRFLFFAVLRNAAKTGELELDCNGTTVADALARLQDAIPALVPYLCRVQVAVNEEYRDRLSLLKEGDTVALIPPVSGGGA